MQKKIITENQFNIIKPFKDVINTRLFNIISAIRHTLKMYHVLLE